MNYIAQLKNRTDSISWLVPIVLLVSVTYLAHYLCHQGFGLYYDDYWAIGDILNLSFSECLAKAIGWFKIGWQSRPLAGFTRFVPLSLCAITGSLQWGYLQGLIVQSLSAYLVFTLFRRFNLLYAIFAALLFILFPAFPLDIYITNTFGPKIALLLILAAMNLYLSGRLIFATILTFCSVMIYEAPAPLVLLAPLLNSEKDWLAWVKKTLLHQLFLILPLVIVALTRFLKADTHLVGKTSLVSYNVLQLAERLATAMVVSIGSYFDRIPFVLSRLNTDSLVVGFVGASLIFLTIVFFMNEAERKLPAIELFKCILFSILCIPASYAILSLKLSPHITTGFGSRVHLVGGVAAGAILGLCSFLLVCRSRNTKQFFTSSIIVSCFVGFLCMNSYLIQQKYLTHWEYNKKFVLSIVESVPDISEIDLLFFSLSPSATDQFSNQYVDETIPPSFWFASWIFKNAHDPQNLPIVAFAKADGTSPMAMAERALQSDHYFEQAGSLFFSAPIWKKRKSYKIQNIAVLAEKNHQFVRVFGKLKPYSTTYDVKKQSVGKMEAKPLLDLFVK